MAHFIIKNNSERRQRVVGTNITARATVDLLGARSRLTQTQVIQDFAANGSRYSSRGISVESVNLDYIRPEDFAGFESSIGTAKFFEDFLADDQKGNQNWSATGVGAGTVVSAVVNSSIMNGGAVGAVGLVTGSTSTGSTLYRQAVGSYPIGFGAMNCSLRVRTSLTSVPTVGEEYIVRAGLGNAVNGNETPTNGFWFEYDFLQSPNWLLRGTIGGVSVVSSTSTATVTGGVWIKLTLDVNAVGTATTYSVDNVNMETSTYSASLVEATNRYAPFVQIQKRVGLASRNFFLDYCQVRKDTGRV
jgi:hypothetical protein